MIRALLFDLYDTLGTIDIQAYRATKAKMAELSNVPTGEFLETWRKYTRPSARGELLTVEERVARVLDDLGKAPDVELVRRIASLEYGLQLKEVHLFDNVAEILEHFKGQGFKLGLVTNTPNSTRDVPEVLGIKKFFDTMVFSFRVGVLKPDPRIYLVACEELGVKPYECVFIGDGNDKELDGADALGMRTVIVGQQRHELLRHEQSQSYDYRIQQIDELRDIVSELMRTTV